MAPVLYILFAASRAFPGRAAMGLRTANLLRSFWIVPTALLLSGIAVLFALHFHTLHAPAGPRLFLATYIGYMVWSFVQQLLLLTFFLPRLQLIASGNLKAAAASALIFALAHLPNPILTPATLVWGFFASLLFLRYRNLVPFALAHAILGITVAITLPGYVTHNMRVGLGYLHYRRPAPHHRSHTDQIVSTQAWVSAEAPTRRSARHARP